jgi:hypothetical protein
MGRDPFGIFKEGEVHTISYSRLFRDGIAARRPRLRLMVTL